MGHESTTIDRAWRAAARAVAGLLLVLHAGCMGEIIEGDGAGGDEVAQAASTIRLVRAGSGKCLDVDAAGTASGTKLHQWTCNDTVAQEFRLDARGSGVYRLVNPNANKCVDVDGAGTASGTKLQLWSCNSSGAQRFRIESVGGGYSRVVNTNSGKCLDVNAASSADGAKVQIWTCNGTAAQRWRVEDLGDTPTPPPPTPPTPPTPPPTPPGDGLVWRRANLTHFTSYPEPGSEECEDYSGCMWAGYFAFVDGRMSESWVQSHNIIAVHSRDAGAYALKTLRLRKGGSTIDGVVYDMCADSDCSGCCTRNASETGFLIDIESYTRVRFGHGDGIVEWACLDCD
jgi:hypothetical protein